MPTYIERPTRIQAAGNMPKIIDEYVGRVNLPRKPEDQRLSVAHMRSPADGWSQDRRRSFEEYTIVLRGRLRFRHEGGEFDVLARPGLIAHPGEWVQYSSSDEATEYIAICLPAFSPQTVHRDDAQ